MLFISDSWMMFLHILGEKDEQNKTKENSLKNLMTMMKELLPKLREQQTKLIIILDAVNEVQYGGCMWLIMIYNKAIMVN
jgi:hypothetical protein